MHCFLKKGGCVGVILYTTVAQFMSIYLELCTLTTKSILPLVLFMFFFKNVYGIKTIFLDTDHQEANCKIKNKVQDNEAGAQ